MILLTKAQDRVLAGIADAMDAGRPFLASPGHGPVRVLVGYKLIVGDQDARVDNQWPWTLTAAGQSLVARAREGISGARH